MKRSGKERKALGRTGRAVDAGDGRVKGVRPSAFGVRHGEDRAARDTRICQNRADRGHPECARRWVRLILLLWAGVCFGQVGPGDRATVELSGKVTGGSGKHTIHVAVWNEAGFLAHPVEEVRIAPGAATEFHFDVKRGRWALSAYEDVNENAKLDMGLFGPKEPSGFWRPFHAWRKPRFDDVALEVERDTSGIEIRVK